MDNDTRLDECQMSFFLHIWREDGERPSCRGRVHDGDGGHSSVFEDEYTLLSFIRGRLSRESIAMPWRQTEGGAQYSLPSST
jgi:hypothetical protein